MSIKSKLKVAWNWYCFIAGVLVISVVLSYGLLYSLVEDGPVITAQGEPRDVSKTVPVGGMVKYTFDTIRHASCPGYVIINLTSRTNHGPPAVVTFRRPVRNVEIKEYENVHAEVRLPESVFPGIWSLQSSVDSRCPTYERSDILATFDFEVVPK